MYRLGCVFSSILCVCFQVPTFKMHMYTLIQLAGICVLYAVKSSRFSLALPFFLVLMVPLRMGLVYLFTPLQLRAVCMDNKYLRIKFQIPYIILALHFTSPETKDLLIFYVLL